MITNTKVFDMLVKQIANEYGNHFLYLKLAGHYENLNYRGFANYFREQANEEIKHAFKILQYLYKKQYVFTVPTAVERDMPTDMTDLGIAQARLELEENTTKEWYDIYEMAKGQYGIVSVNGMKKYTEIAKCEPSVVQDIVTEFIKIQDNEVQEANDFIAKVKMTTNILALDHELQENEGG